MIRSSVRCAFALALLLAGGIVLGENERAPELRKSNAWINSGPLTLSGLKGKTVLIDFWAFDCAPCIETAPHIRDLYNRYSKAGLVVIGVHAPRTVDEHDVRKLREAVKRMDIQYPVVVDDAHKIWDDYRCDVWPTVFVIDGSGAIRYIHGGTGRYDELEKTIQGLLSSR